MSYFGAELKLAFDASLPSNECQLTIFSAFLFCLKCVRRAGANKSLFMGGKDSVNLEKLNKRSSHFLD